MHALGSTPDDRQADSVALVAIMRSLEQVKNPGLGGLGNPDTIVFNAETDPVCEGFTVNAYLRQYTCRHEFDRITQKVGQALS